MALLSGTTRAIIDLALCLPWQRGDRLVLFRGEFPANITPWQQAARLFDLRLSYVELLGAHRDVDRVLGPLEELLRQGVRLVSVCAVQFQTGLAMPLRQMADLCHQHGAELVDAIQAAGVVPIDVGAAGIDYLAGGAHKWLMGLEGAGYLYVRPELGRSLEPRTAGWLSHEDGTGFLSDGPGQLRYDRPIQVAPRFLETSSSSVAAFAAMGAGLVPILELGVQRIHAHVNAYLDDLERGLEERGLESFRAREPARRSGILSVGVPKGVSAPELASALRESGVHCTTPDGLLRFAPHFPNAFSEVPRVLDALDESLGRLRG